MSVLHICDQYFVLKCICKERTDCVLLYGVAENKAEGKSGVEDKAEGNSELAADGNREQLLTGHRGLSEDAEAHEAQGKAAAPRKRFRGKLRRLQKTAPAKTAEEPYQEKVAKAAEADSATQKAAEARKADEPRNANEPRKDEQAVHDKSTQNKVTFGFMHKSYK